MYALTDRSTVPCLGKHSSSNRSRYCSLILGWSRRSLPRPCAPLPRLLRQRVAAAGDENRGSGDGWAQKIKDSLPEVEPNSSTSPSRPNSRQQDDIRRTEYAALDVWNNEIFFKMAGIMAGVLLFLLIVGGPP